MTAAPGELAVLSAAAKGQSMASRFSNTDDKLGMPPDEVEMNLTALTARTSKRKAAALALPQPKGRRLGEGLQIQVPVTATAATTDEATGQIQKRSKARAAAERIVQATAAPAMPDALPNSASQRPVQQRSAMQRPSKGQSDAEPGTPAVSLNEHETSALQAQAATEAAELCNKAGQHAQSSHAAGRRGPGRQSKLHEGKPASKAKHKHSGNVQRATSPGTEARDNALKQKLLDAWERFQEHLQDRKKFTEIDVATCMRPEAAVGRPVRIFWPDEDAWFCGEVTSFDAASGQHQVGYADGDKESLWLASGVERVRMLLSAAEALVGPSPQQLHDLSQTLLSQAQSLRQGPHSSSGEVEKLTALEACSLRLQHAAENKAKQLEDSRTDRHLPGTVVWATARGWPFWPSLVCTREEAAANGVRGCTGGVWLQAFGVFTWDCARPRDVVSFPEGVQQGLFQKRGRSSFQRAIFEVLAYLEEGELPEAMTPLNNDEGFSSDDKDDLAVHEAMASKPNETADLKVNDQLTVNSLGRIEYLHRGFHNEKNIWPVGYRATSIAASPASGGSPQGHVCSIVAAADGSGPLFRIACGDVVAESRASPQRAWLMLLPDAISRGRATGQEGIRLFGFTNRRVVQCVQQLPNASRCEHYACWPDGMQPERVRLTVSEQRARAKAEVARQQLPEGIAPQPHAPLEEDRCEACGTDEESEDNLLLQCDGPCRSFIHQDCCGVLDRPAGSWMCELCKTGSATAPACVLCPTKGGALLRTRCGRWCHAACALWVPEAFIDTEGPPCPLVDVSRVPKARRQLQCSVCKQAHGACIQCSGHSRCFTAFHPLCARGAGLVMDSVHDEAFCPDGSPPEAVATLPPADPTTGGQAPEVKRQRRSSWYEGTAVGDGTKLVCYCRRHQPQQQPPSMPAGAQAGRQSSRLAAETRPSPESSRRLDGDAADSSRCRSFNHALRRGLRAPEVVAAAIEKRSFLRAEAYQVSELPARAGRSPPPPSSCILPESRDSRFPSSSAGVGTGVSGQPGKAAALNRVATGQSVSERYWQMRATESQRVALGKSAIHGWGALSKVHHKKGDMVIEYSGELIRLSLADVRELQLYDRLVGAGTYVFRMNADMCVDATRSGNLAHMLNHSCQPNCFSRTVQVTIAAGCQEEHVVIFANEAIPPGRELVYDYRFSSSEVLPCNCGAPACCGLVNESGAPQQEFATIPRAQLRPLR